MKVFIKRMMIFTFAAMFLLGSSVVCAAGKKSDSFKIKAIDVGPGSSYLIINHGVVTLVDTGVPIRFATVNSALKKEKVKTIHNLVLTHTHQDHIGTAGEVLMNFKVKNVYMPKYKCSNPSYLKLMSVMEQKRLKVKYLYHGQRINIGAKASCKVLSPQKDKKYSDPNSSSIVMMIQHGNNKFLLMGDAPQTIEKQVMASDNVKCDVLFAGHHGSDASSNSSFLKACSPKYCVVSVGKSKGKSVYPYPMECALKRIVTYSANVLRTDYNGTISFVSNGTTIKVKKSKKGPVMNFSSLKMSVGQMNKLRVSNYKGKLKWTSSDSKVAAVSSDGKIRALQKGTTRIYATATHAAFMCTVTVSE